MTYHTMLGFCHWDVPAAILLVAVIAMLAFRNHKMKKQYEELEAMLDEATGAADMVADVAEQAIPLDK